MLRTAAIVFACLVAAAPAARAAQYVRMDTIRGDITLELYDDVAPGTVANFMNYVNDGDYVDSIIHRSEPGFVIQGGGYAFYPDDQGVDYFWYVPTDPWIVNEFDVSNTYGTIAMAKVGPQYDGEDNLIPGTGPDSATSQWFFNLADNLGLDVDNGGYTVFGRVIDGIAVVEDIASLPIWDASSITPAFGSLPMIDYVNGQPITAENLVMIYAVAPVATFRGDADLDGDVDLTDLSVLAFHWDTATGASWRDGDFDGDGDVDLTDLSALAFNWDQGTTAPAAVPEPAGLALLAAAAVLGLRRRRKTTCLRHVGR